MVIKRTDDLDVISARNSLHIKKYSPWESYWDKPPTKVENAVLLTERWIIAALCHRKLFCMAELNDAIAALLNKLNQRRFRKRDGSRASLFAEVDRPALQPLPAEPYEFAQWKTVRANIDYHVDVDRHFYSVAYQRFTATTVEIFHRGIRIASHVRSYTPYRATTIAEHLVSVCFGA